MRQYVLKRLFLVVPTLFLITIIVFALIRSIPGDVVVLDNAGRLDCTVWGDILTEICAHQFVFQSIERFRLELAVGNQRRDGGTERRRGAREPIAQALPPVSVLRAVVHALPVIAVSA